ncbi:glycine betaine ABC transporter substrate-binding protein [Mycetocola reblochoni]|uniref:L-proline glycine betaine ABC transport system permease protein ProW (TC 3.A.1.12.1) n=2 Tax=Mycetocola reblochoni TaxID=331618 RepID=A0A1R4JM73_9MICO|nr:glycine betaine ABC transporter substrate-binding protein [Mycetocola reblochoni]RLP68570.1 glycine betaine ABC transporter substrate-binding protein [Mycetocola reblochoni]SJN33062.1 L-proline glycine betaine ABC transport system permease protein ProW (TC 3.A.1.12.1) [Mycetocola reblochoni REB411]
MKSFTKIALSGVAVAGLLGVAGCSSSGSSDETLENGDAKDVTIAVFNGWDEGIAASELWKAVLEGEGYEVELEYADPAPVYQGLSDNDYDLTLDTWLPVTHKSYIDQYGDKITDLGAWNEEAKLTIAVNEDAPIDSLDELADNADLFGNQLVGIEPGAGLTEVTTDKVIPEYGLEDMDYLTSSTPAMLTELKAATDKGDNVAVTLWRPHWAYDAFPIKDLEDPKGALGGAEGIHSFGSNEFEEKYPTLTGWLQNFSMDNEHLYSLENVMFNENDTDDYGPIVEQWIADNQEYVDGLTK